VGEKNRLSFGVPTHFELFFPIAVVTQSGRALVLPAAEGAIRPESLRYPVPLLYCPGLVDQQGSILERLASRRIGVAASAEGERPHRGLTLRQKDRRAVRASVCWLTSFIHVSGATMSSVLKQTPLHSVHIL